MTNVYNIPHNERPWQCFSMKSIEDEYHFVMVCPSYRHLLLRYLPKYDCSWLNMSKFISFIQTSSFVI